MSPDDEHTRRRLVNEIVDIGKTLFPADVSVHWDDCNEGQWSTWIHVRWPALLDRGTGSASQVTRHFNTWRARIDKLASPAYYNAYLNLLDCPRRRYSVTYGYRSFAGYETDVWVFRLNFYGGPDAVRV